MENHFGFCALKSPQTRMNTDKNGWTSKVSTPDGGRGWIRTTEVSDDRFTVCSLWPLGNSPIYELFITHALCTACG